MILGLEDTCHVYEDGGDIYNAVLGLVDLTKGTNSYYKVQVLVHDTAKEYAPFISALKIVKYTFSTELSESKDIPVDFA